MRKILWICALAASATLLQGATAYAQTAVIMRATLTGGEETPSPILAPSAPSKSGLIRSTRKLR